MPIVLDEINLRTLNLRVDELEALEEKEQLSIIKKAYYKLSRQYHPDKNNGVADARLSQVQTAYQNLTANGLTHTPDSYFKKYPIYTRNDAFDLLGLEGVEKAANDLKAAFSALTSEQQKQDFAAYYGPFLNLAEHLETKKPDILRECAAQLRKTFSEQLSYDWRKFIIRLYGEEYLDDFQYRQALASGRLWPILATRKLLSPAKLIVAIINSINLVVCSSIGYYFLNLIFTKFAEFLSFLPNEEVDVTTTFTPLLELLLAVLPLYAFIFFAPAETVGLILIVLIELPLLTVVLDYIASPVNKIVRPFADFTNLPPLVSCALLTLAGAGAVYAAMNYVTVAGLFLLLPHLTIALNIYSIYLNAVFVKFIYDLDPRKGIFLGLYLSILVLPDLLLPGSGEVMALFLTALVTCSLNSINNKMFVVDAQQMQEKTEELPLPAAEVPENIRKAALSGYKKAIHSHRLFGTPKEAEYQENRSFWQQTASFFGGGERRTAQEIPHCNMPPVVLAL